MSRRTIGKCRPARAGERGSALVMALFVLVLLLAMGTALLSLSETELKMSRSHLDAKRSFYLAEAGLEDGRRTLFANNGGEDFSPDLATAGGGGPIDFDPDALQATYDAFGNVTGLNGFNDDVPLRSLTPFGSSTSSGWYAAFLTNDAGEGTGSVSDVNSRVMITGVGLGSRRSMEIVQAIVEPFRPLPALPPAAITMLGPSPSFDNGKSKAQWHTGNDCSGSGIPGLYVPIVGGVSESAAEQIQNDINRPERFSSGPYTEEDTIGDLTDPTDPIVADSGLGTIHPDWMDCPYLVSLVDNLALTADYYCNTDLSSCSLPATTAPGRIYVIDGDYSTSGFHAGILVVTGELTFNGNSGWNGALLVIGEGLLVRHGGGGGKPSGAVVIAHIDPSAGSPYGDRSDWCSGSADGFMQGTYDTRGSGSSMVEYCSAALDAANAVATYEVVEFLQR